MKKIILILAGFWFLFFESFGQEILWQKTIGGDDFDIPESVEQTMDGGYIIGGWSRSTMSGDKTENNWDTICSSGYCTADYWIIKTDSIGNIQWQNTIGGNFNDQLYSVHQTNDGGYILGGYSHSNITGDKTENNAGGGGIGDPDFWIIKTDVSGNIQWQNTIGGTGGEYLYSLEQTTDNGYILGGVSTSNISGDKTENSFNGTFDYWIVKTDSIGNIQWQNTIGGTDQDYFRSLQQTSDEGYILGGWSYSNISGDKTENSNGGWDYWVVKVDSIGNIQWQNTIGGSQSDWLNNVCQTTDGGYICEGVSVSNISGDKTENCIGGRDFWIIKLDSAGNIIWQNTIGGTGEEGDNSFDIYDFVTPASDGGCIIGGASDSNISGDKTENTNGGLDYWVMKLDVWGNIQWQNTIGGFYMDRLCTGKQTSDGGFILGGHSSSNISGDKTENSWDYSADYWVVKITDKFNSITGKLFYDLNNNQIQDVGELPARFNQVAESNTGRFNFSNQNGEYLVSVLDSGNFSISPASINYYNNVPTNHTSYFSGIQQNDSLNDFAFQPAGVFNDLCVTITPMGNFRAWFNANYMINYENVGTTTLNATVIFFPDNDVTFSSSNPTATSITTDSVVWNVGTLTPFQTGSILVTVNVNAATPIGTLINSNVRIEPVAGDNYPGCNYAYWEVYTTASSDPNAILVDRDTVLTTELSSPPYLNYIVYFQNTGNDTAFNARVLNNIPQTLDVNSFEFVASSHPMNITYGAHSRLFTFTFDNILLPDSNVNEPASHGFIRYKIKPLSTLAVGDSIKNNAAIYFDFNQPVMTNTAVTEIVLPTGAEEFDVQSLKFKIFPNPVRDELEIKNPQQGDKTKYEIAISDITGRLNLRVQEAKLPAKLDVSKFAAGIYFLVINDGNTFFRTKVVKQ